MYGRVLPIPGIAVERGIVDPQSGVDRRALAWHAYVTGAVDARSCWRTPPAT
jgi:hypothetical protein